MSVRMRYVPRRGDRLAMRCDAMRRDGIFAGRYIAASGINGGGSRLQYFSGK